MGAQTWDFLGLHGWVSLDGLASTGRPRNTQAVAVAVEDCQKGGSWTSDLGCLI